MMYFIKYILCVLYICVCYTLTLMPIELNVLNYITHLIYHHSILLLLYQVNAIYANYYYFYLFYVTI